MLSVLAAVCCALLALQASLGYCHPTGKFLQKMDFKKTLLLTGMDLNRGSLHSFAPPLNSIKEKIKI